MPQDDFPFIYIWDWKNRFRLTVSCRDADGMPRVPNAGEYEMYGEIPVQIMHNGIKVVKDAYCGAEQSEIMRYLGGVHEPQEEKVFAAVLPFMPPGATMVELGCWWAYYSMWFQKEVPGARNFCVEPDSQNIEIGIKNFLINGGQATFVQAGVPHSIETLNNESLVTNGKSIYLPLDGSLSSGYKERHDFRRAIPVMTIDSFMADHQLDYIDLLHVDIQLAEHQLLKAGNNAFRDHKIGWIFMSTHGHPESWHTPDMDKYHYECLQMIKDFGYHIVAEHAVSDTYSGDGLIVAKIPSLPGPDTVKISKMSNSDFAGLYNSKW